MYAAMTNNTPHIATLPTSDLGIVRSGSFASWPKTLHDSNPENANTTMAMPNSKV